MKRGIIFLFVLLPFFVMGSLSDVTLDKARNNVADKPSLQRGAALFMNYCLGCHETQYQRYERIAQDLGIPKALMMENLVFDKNAKIGNLITNAMLPEDAVTFFGTPAPDLTLVARVRGVDWIYTYLRSFYADPSRPFGVNNFVFPNVGMPHVLEELQGTPVKRHETLLVDGQFIEEFVGIRTLDNGELSPDEYDSAVRDLVNFLAYSGEPMMLERQRLGYWVIGFLVLFLILSILLKKEYWRDVH